MTLAMMTTTTMMMTEVFEHLPEVELRPGLLPRSFRACALQPRCTIVLLHPVDHDYIDHGVFFILDFDSKCSETDFTQEKVNFHNSKKTISGSCYIMCASIHST